MRTFSKVKLKIFTILVKTQIGILEVIGIAKFDKVGNTDISFSIL